MEREDARLKIETEVYADKDAAGNILRLYIDKHPRQQGDMKLHNMIEAMVRTDGWDHRDHTGASQRVVGRWGDTTWRP